MITGIRGSFWQIIVPFGANDHRPIWKKAFFALLFWALILISKPFVK